MRRAARAIRAVAKVDKWAYLAILVLACISLAVLEHQVVSTESRLSGLASKLSSDELRLDSAGQKITGDEAALCSIQKAGRIDSNRHLRRPLKGIAARIAELFESASATTSDPKQRAQVLALARAFSTYGNQVTILPPVKC